jgi:hypothetical protein
VPGGELAKERDVTAADLSQRIGVERRDEVRIGQGAAVGGAHGQHHVVKRLQFAAAVSKRMAGDDLLDQGRAGTRHADDKHWCRRRIAAAGLRRDQVAGKCRRDAVEQRE